MGGKQGEARGRWRAEEGRQGRCGEKRPDETNTERGGRGDRYLPFDLAVQPGPGLRAWHWGPTDPTGFAAMGVAEILLHTHDIATGLGLDWTPPAGPSAAVLARLFPDAPTGTGADPAAVLLWCTGRTALPGLPRRTSWVWRAALPE
ncbi:hypothetical protein [Kitasatospora sp. NPDC088134]|uniref:hypothetical protein n=1 Tax=Kitasatospora sp. NPDC088134 TaxID=3364071 RepID=UPI0037F104CF